MNRYISLLTTALITVLLAFGISTGKAVSEPKPDATKPVGSEPGSNEAAFAPGRIIVKIEDEAPAGAIESVNHESNARVLEKLPSHRVSVVDLPKDLSVGEAIDSYEESPKVEYAEPDYLLRPEALPNDPRYPRMYELNNRGQTGGKVDADIDAPDAWKVTTGSADTVVAVLDTGIDINHPDLNNNIWTNPDEIAGNGRDDDHNGYVDDVHGWDFHNEDNSVFDGARQDTHGTLVASPIAAEGNNDAGVTGVNWRTKIAPLKIIGADGIAYVSDAMQALDYSVNEGIQISNNSWGGGSYSKFMFDAIKRAGASGHLFVAAAGNGGADFVGDNSDAQPFYPASYDSSNIISVAASNKMDTFTSFSNYGADSVDLAAPGRDIPCTMPGNAYSYCWGTSIATPHVAGAAALIKSQRPNLNDEEVKARILGSVDKVGSLRGKLVTGGRLNAAKALGANTAPVVSNVKPNHSRVRPRGATVSAKVHDDETNLTKDQIRLYFDGKPKSRFSYDRETNRLTYRTGKLASRRHYVRVVVEDAQALGESRSWSFRVTS